MGRTILGAMAGLLVAFFTIMVVEFAGHQVYPPPPGLDPMVPADMAMIMQSMPLGAMLLVVVAWLTGAFDGGFVAALVARGNRPRVAAVVPALLVMAGVVGMVVQLPGHPLWMSIAGLLLPIPVALAGAGLASRRKPAAR
ncbi:MAG: hypothetical protein KBD58_02365 [Thermomonas sp.]|uniref:hypothetical protein n=1 Tax=Thermomonas sp. TaxID=1971895 RepID=UPI001B4D2848|nr:hypothetical protein [Thermomonas sp.]